MEVGGQLHAPTALSPGNKLGTHLIWGWVGPGVDLEVCEKISPPPGFDPRTVQLVASRYTDYVIVKFDISVFFESRGNSNFIDIWRE